MGLIDSGSPLNVGCSGNVDTIELFTLCLEHYVFLWHVDAPRDILPLVSLESVL